MARTKTIKVISIKKIMEILKEGTNIDSDIDDALKLIKGFKFDNRHSVIERLKTKEDAFSYGYSCGADFVLEMLEARINKIAEEIIK